MIYRNVIISAIWVLDADIDGNIITINRYGRNDKIGYPKRGDQVCNLIEGPGRIVEKVVIGVADGVCGMLNQPRTTYIVSNPKHVFSYKG